MDKMKFETPDLTSENIEKIVALFPNCVAEMRDEDGKLKRGINFEILKQMLSPDVVDGDECYEFTWVGKKASIVEANKPIRKTLRPCPCPEESKNWDTTENLYIEGDNLEVLKLLQEAYLGKVKMIYIDPPYNTGNDFIYADDFMRSQEEENEQMGMYDEDENRLFKNTDTNGKFHSDWCSMIYSRLLLSRNLLTEDGVIFISIDDNEQENLKKCCDEVFGAQNFIAQLIWERAFSPKNDARFISNSHDYVLMYARDITKFVIGRLPRTEEANARYSNPDNDPRGVWMSSDISVKTYNPECDYPITTPSGRVIEPPAGRCWSLSPKAFLERLQDNRIWFGPDGNGVPRIKRFLTDLKHQGMAPTSIMFFKDVGHSQEGAQEVSKLMDGGFFSGPKPQRLMKRLLTLSNLKSDSIVLDFFSGSASTAHAVMQLNAEDDGHRKFIMVQLPETTGEKSEAYKAGYQNICEIGKERIRRAAKKIAEEHPDAKFDGGFRVLKCDSSNMKDVYYNPDQYEPSLFSKLEDNIKEDRTPEDLLFQVMLDLGVLLSGKIEETTIAGKKVFNVEDNYLIACFDEDITEETITAIAKQKPYYFVMRDSSMANDSVATNFEQIFAAYSPDTVRKIL